MSKTLETVGAVHTHTHTHTHTSQFLNKRNVVAASYESAFLRVCDGRVASVFVGILFFINYIEYS